VLVAAPRYVSPRAGSTQQAPWQLGRQPSGLVGLDARGGVAVCPTAQVRTASPGGSLPELLVYDLQRRLNEVERRQGETARSVQDLRREGVQAELTQVRCELQEATARAAEALAERNEARQDAAVALRRCRDLEEAVAAARAQKLQVPAGSVHATPERREEAVATGSLGQRLEASVGRESTAETAAGAAPSVSSTGYYSRMAWTTSASVPVLNGASAVAASSSHAAPLTPRSLPRVTAGARVQPTPWRMVVGTEAGGGAGTGGSPRCSRSAMDRSGCGGTTVLRPTPERLLRGSTPQPRSPCSGRRLPDGGVILLERQPSVLYIPASRMPPLPLVKGPQHESTGSLASL